MKTLLLSFIGTTFTNYANISVKNVVSYQTILKNDINQSSINNNIKNFNNLEMLYDFYKSISWDKKQIFIDKSKFNKDLWPEKLYSLIISNDYQKLLQSIYDANNFSIFFNKFSINDLEKNELMQAWGEYYWYWFAYWRLHLTKEECDRVNYALQTTGDALATLGDFLDQATLTVSKILIIRVVAAIFYLISNDWLTENGMKIHFVGIIPVYFEKK